MKFSHSMLFLLCLGLIACPDQNDRQIRVEPILRRSCSPTTTYEISCVRSLMLELTDDSGQRIKNRCTAAVGEFVTMQDLVTIDHVVKLLDGVKEEKNVRLELRGYHSIDKEPCTNLTDADLIFWGTSSPFDLTNTELKVVNVNIECRPECDCTAIETEPSRCPTALQSGMCFADIDTSCRKSCTATEQCYGGIINCQNNQCIGDSGEMCATCTSSNQCGVGPCVQNVNTNEAFCAMACPSPGLAEPCPSGMRCQKIDGAPFSTLP